LLSKYPWGVKYLIYSGDFIINRVFPKLPVTKKIYFFLTHGHNRVLSKAETYGRLYSCGFEIVEEAFIGDRLFFVVRKIKEPAFDYHPTYGPVIHLKRLGKNGKIISVYKLRTMHAYSEYLQGYIYERNKLQPGGKFKDDFRVTTLGRIFRMLWIDELPMLINLIKGDLKIVGVRPLSQHYFDLYTNELKEKRIKYKPGLIPPFYADLPETLQEIMDSEMRYLLSYEKNPFQTDFRYFRKAMWNILFRHARSK
jgi:lipopolysaccharide/colanic/teichoic acid biosynthesis glycosyltransferase